jgi:lipopolysaccharide export system protein LptA
MKRLMFVFCLLAPLVASAAAHAATKCAADAPVNVASDKFIADSNAKTGTFTGNVMVSQCDIKLRANSVRVNVVGSQPDKIVAQGNVVVDSPSSGTATGDNAVYDVKPRIVTLNGRVVLTRGKDVMRGPQLTVNLITGQAQLGGGVKAVAGAPTQSGGRVQAIFSTPPPTARRN